MPAKGVAIGTHTRYNVDGLTHLVLPFMFHLTACGLPVRRYRHAPHRKRSLYTACKRCFPVLDTLPMAGLPLASGPEAASLTPKGQTP